MVTIIKKRLVTIRFSDKDADEIFRRSCNKQMTVGQYLKWFIRQSLKKKEVKEND